MNQTIEGITAENTNTVASNEENQLEKTVQDTAISTEKQRFKDEVSDYAFLAGGFVVIGSYFAAGFYRGINGLPCTPPTGQDYSVSDICEYGVTMTAISSCALETFRAKTPQDAMLQIQTIPAIVALGAVVHLFGYSMGQGFNK